MKKTRILNNCNHYDNDAFLKNACTLCDVGALLMSKMMNMFMVMMMMMMSMVMMMRMASEKSFRLAVWCWHGCTLGGRPGLWYFPWAGFYCIR